MRHLQDDVAGRLNANNWQTCHSDTVGTKSCHSRVSKMTDFHNIHPKQWYSYM